MLLRAIDAAELEMNAGFSGSGFFNEITSLQFDGKSGGILNPFDQKLLNINS
jgi:hypothetical protein